LLLLSRVSAECPEGYLGTSVYLLPYTHPVIAAEATAFLDVMWGGRLLFGVGRGYRAVELESLGIPRVERGERLVEAVQAVRTLWADDPASFDGRSRRAEEEMRTSLRAMYESYARWAQPGEPWIQTSL
jgi:alkanesulfonate monooxygenase SsuD/methylene tetrahydromethanopterin reductase-like flavin-dependent oxidoreductase (luciferase family)